MARKKRKDIRRRGLAVDTFGNQVIYDPSANVIALNEAGNVRQDDLRKLNNRYIKSEIKRVEQIAEMKAAHSGEIAALHQEHDYAIHRAEAGRLDALRQNDREDVKALAALTTAKAEALQGQVALTAKTLADSFATAMAEQNKRLSAVELSLSEGRGKATVESPMMQDFIAKVDRLVSTQYSTQGAKQGVMASRDWIVAFIGLVLTLLTIYSLIRVR